MILWLLVLAGVVMIYAGLNKTNPLTIIKTTLTGK